MKVVCVDNSIHKNLQVGEIYEGELIFSYTSVKSTIFDEMSEGLDWSQNFLRLEGHPRDLWYDCRFFIKLETWRQNQISKLI